MFVSAHPGAANKTEKLSDCLFRASFAFFSGTVCCSPWCKCMHVREKSVEMKMWEGDKHFVHAYSIEFGNGIENKCPFLIKLSKLPKPAHGYITIHRILSCQSIFDLQIEPYWSESLIKLWSKVQFGRWSGTSNCTSHSLIKKETLCNDWSDDGFTFRVSTL